MASVSALVTRCDNSGPSASPSASYSVAVIPSASSKSDERFTAITLGFRSRTSSATRAH